MDYIVSIVFLISLTKSLNPEFNFFQSIFTLPKLSFHFFFCFALYTLYADNRIVYFLVLGKISDVESGHCNQVKKDVTF